MRANDLKPGTAIKHDGKLMVVMSTEHTKPGKGPAYIQARMRDVVSGQYTDKRFGSTDKIEDTTLDRRQMEYLYADSDGHIFMDNETYDQITLVADLLGDNALYLTPNLGVTVSMHEGNPVTIELPASVDLEVVDTPPGIKGATATNQLKEATLETGLKTKVPPFITTGEKIRVSTADGAYQARSSG